MAAAVTITTFSGLAPPWSLTQLDTDLTNLQSAIGNQNNFSNYLVDTGVANVYAVAPAAGITGTLTAGLMLQFKAVAANTGASTLNYNGLGAKNILNLDGSALNANQILANAVAVVIYDGTQFLLLTTVPVYVVGPWTPAVGGNATYTTQIGSFTKIGNRVFIEGEIGINVLGTGSTSTMSGLPYQVTSNTSGAVSLFASLAVSPVFLACNPVIGGKTMVFNGLTAAAASTSNAMAIFGNSASVRFNAQYHTTE